MAIYNSSNSTADSAMPPLAADSPSELNNYDSIWTAYNGYQLKIYRDGIAGDYHRFPETMEFRPTNQAPLFQAYLDFFGRKSIHRSIPVEDFYMSPENVPLVDLASTKLTQAVSTPSFEAFRSAFHNLWLNQMFRWKWQKNNMSPNNYLDKANLLISDDGTRIVTGDFDNPSLTLTHTNFGLEYMKDSEEKCWRLEISYSWANANVPTQLMWTGIRNLLRLVEPDAELLYQQIYEHFYGGNHIFPAYDVWVPIGNSELLVEQAYYKRSQYHISYYFR